MESLQPSEISAALNLLRSHLSGNLISTHLFGSAVAGGLRPHSDVDILLAVRRSLEQDARKLLATGLLTVSGNPRESTTLRPLEVTVVVLDDVVPWRYPPRREFQYGEWLRDDVTAGKPLLPALDPDLAVVLAQVQQNSRTLSGPDAVTLFDPVPSADLYRALLDIVPDLVSAWRGDERNVVLTLARVWVTLTSGEIVPKDVAAQCLANQLPARCRNILEIARSEYLGERVQNWSTHGDKVAEYVRYMEQNINTHLRRQD